MNIKENYKLQQAGVFRLDTNQFIPKDSRNSHWIRYLKWLDEGNTPVPQFTIDESRKNRWEEVLKILEDKKNGCVIVNRKVVCSSPEIKSNVHSILLEIESGSIKLDAYFLVNNHPNYREAISLTEKELKMAHNFQTKLYQLCYENAKKLQGLINNSKEPNTIDINQGWPSVPFIDDKK